MLLSICVPTYNRGKRALELAKELEQLWEQYPEDIEIVFSNNGSTKEKEEYETIKMMASDHFTYFEFDENRQYVGNYNQVIRLSKAQWCLIISDEDHIFESNFDLYIDIIKNNPGLSMVRGCTNYNYLFNLGNKENTGFRNAGKEALEAYFLRGNYISGIIYNRALLTNEVVDKLEEDYLTESDNKAYYSYPHMFVEAILLLSGDIYISPDLLIVEGETASDITMDKKMEVPFYATYNERLQQAQGYLEFVKRIQCTYEQKNVMILKIINRTFYLVSIVKDEYIATGHEWRDVVEIIYEELQNLLFSSDIDIFKYARRDYLDYLDAIKVIYLNS